MKKKIEDELEKLEREQAIRKRILHSDRVDKIYGTDPCDVIEMCALIAEGYDSVSARIIAHDIRHLKTKVKKT